MQRQKAEFLLMERKLKEHVNLKDSTQYCEFTLKAADVGGIIEALQIHRL